MSERNIEPRTIEITEFAFNKIMSWGQALDEVAFFAIGKDNMITDAVRLLNTSGAPRNYFDYSKKEAREFKEKIQMLDLEIICMGHSHPHKDHKQYPSKADFQGLPKKQLQMIVLPIKNEVTIWQFKKTYVETLKSSYSVLLLNK